MKNLTDDEMVQAFEIKYKFLQEDNFHPTFNIMDNAASHTIKEFIKKENVDLQLVRPHQNCTNAAKCAIQNFKDHSLSALGTTDPLIPI